MLRVQCSHETTHTILIIKLGSTFSELSQQMGDFEDWISQPIIDLGFKAEVFDAKCSSPLPDVDYFAGIILTGSSAMVTDRAGWSERLKPWLIECFNKKIPILGICYGHQLLADTFGGVVENRKNGAEIGTVTITKSLNSQQDRLFKNLPVAFSAQTVHWQSVTVLPRNAVLLASSQLDMNHAFRLGETIWGIQFHPEFSKEVMSFYMNEYESILLNEGKHAEKLKKNISSTTSAHLILKEFIIFCLLLR